MRGYSTTTPAGRGSLKGVAPRRPRPPVAATLRELTAILAVIGVLAGLLWLSYRGVDDALTTHPIAMPVPIAGTRTLRQPLLVDIAVDESGSMDQSDPSNDRWTSVAALARWLSQYERPTDMLAITRFTDSAATGPIVSVKRLTADPRALAPNPPGGGTAFVPVVDAAASVFGADPAARRPLRVLLIVTDGDAPDRDRAIARLPHVADRVFLIALDRSNTWNNVRGSWETAGFPVTTLANRTPNEVGAALAKDILRVTGEKSK